MSISAPRYQDLCAVCQNRETDIGPRFCDIGPPILLYRTPDFAISAPDSVISGGPEEGFSFDGRAVLYLAVLRAKIKIKNFRIRAGIGPKPMISLGKWQSGPSPGTPRAKEKNKNHFKHSQVSNTHRNFRETLRLAPAVDPKALSN